MIEYKLYTKSNCAPCSSMKARLNLLGLSNFVTELDTHESVHRNALIDMGFRTVPVLVCVDTDYTDGLPFVLNSIQGRSIGHTDEEFEDFFKGMYDE